MPALMSGLILLQIKLCKTSAKLVFFNRNSSSVVLEPLNYIFNDFQHLFDTLVFESVSVTVVSGLIQLHPCLTESHFSHAEEIHLRNFACAVNM